MAWVACDKNGKECVFKNKPVRYENQFEYENSEWAIDDEHEELEEDDFMFVEVPVGTIKRLTGSWLTWGDEPVELR